jgi:hypothetical protein
MTNAWRGIIIVGLALSVAACARVGDTWVAMSDQCSVAAAGTDWSTVPVKTITWEDDGFQPVVVQLHPNTPYVLRLVDGRKDKAIPHPRFAAPIFFESVQLASIGGAAPDGRCVRAVDVAGKSTDIHLITGDGDQSYDFGAFSPWDPVIKNVAIDGTGWPDLVPGLTPGSGVISVR